MRSVVNARSLSRLFAAVLIAVSPGSAAFAQNASAAPDYRKDSSWLCLPGRVDACSTPLPTTDLGPSGYGARTDRAIAKDPPLDCFYVYPTVSSDPGFNSGIEIGAAERITAQIQFARFASVCRTFAPVYRQMTVGTIAVYAAGADIRAAGELAYSDVLAAWRNYLETRNNGRPFVLIGHSQGSYMLQQLIAREIENDPAQKAKMRLAIIPGYNVLVPLGKRVGGTFKSTPLCSRSGETGCVMAWSSFRVNNAPPTNAMFGDTDEAGMTVGCVNPASPGSPDWVKLDSDWFTRSGIDVPGGPIRWSTQGQPATPFVHTHGLVSGRCINAGGKGYLSIRTNHVAGEKWTDRIGGEVPVLGMFLPGWGMHLSDVDEAEGDLVRTVGDIGAGLHPAQTLQH